MPTPTAAEIIDARLAEQQPGYDPVQASREALRRGLRGSSLPPGCNHVKRATDHFRRLLEDEVMAAKSEIDLADAALINTAFRYERHAQLAQHWLYKEADRLTASDRLTYSREVARASAERDKAIAALGLTSKPVATLQSQYDAALARLIGPAPPVTDAETVSHERPQDCAGEPHNEQAYYTTPKAAQRTRIARPLKYHIWGRNAKHVDQHIHPSPTSLPSRSADPH